VKANVAIKRMAARDRDRCFIGFWMRAMGLG